MRASGVRNPEAFIAYQKSIEFNNAALELGGAELVAGLLVTNKFLERAIELEPDFSWAHFDHADYYLHFVMHAALQDDLADGAIDEALELAEKDLRNAVRTAKREGDRLGATLELALVSGQWQRLPELLAAVYESSDCAYVGFWGAVATSLDPPDDEVAARALLDEIIGEYGDDVMPVMRFAMLGDRERANQRAAVWDARPLGILNLLITTGACSCGAPFDLEATPNFARLIEEAELPWPPPRPIEWPLKDW
ncbi:MAG: hypothetical protein IIA07_08850 [Proteobacteria bacterium]|nr:hypothetical protein [Pseudomonadota bacterium]